MKYFTPVFIILLFSLEGKSQSISIDYNSVHIGRNIGLSYLYLLKENHEIFVGFKYHINNIIHDNQNNVFKKRFYANNLKEHIGLDFGYNYILPVNDKNKLLFFYDNQFTIAGTRGEVFLPSNTINGITLYSRLIIEFPPLKAMEHYIGIGFRAKVWNKFSVSFKIGGGVSHFWDIPERSVSGGYITLSGKPSWEFGGIISAGLQYEINSQ
jgi:hypothetical protein